MSSLSEVFATRAWFAADLVRDLEPGMATLMVRPGARITVIWRSTGLPFDQRSDPNAVLEPAVGDVLIVCGQATDEIAAAAVIAIGPPLRVRLGAGLAVGTAVHVTSAQDSTAPAQCELPDPRADLMVPHPAEHPGARS